MARRLNNMADMVSGRRRTDSDDGVYSRDTFLEALVVDDDENFRRFIASVATRLGFAVTEAEDGDGAMDALVGRSFDLLIFDDGMPRLTGLQAISAVRANEATRNAYALMLTGHDDAETKIAALTAGYDDFVSKASTELEIAAKIVAARRLVSRQKTLDVMLRELYGLATRDELTGLFNRRFFTSEIERMIVHDVPLTIVLFDLDEFKIVNDTYGHLAGDRILRDVGALFLRSTRSEDLVARYGGDEFVMVIAHLPATEVESIVKRIATEIASLRWKVNDVELAVGATVGIAASGMMPRTTLQHLLNAADRDLYNKKWTRKNPETAPPARRTDFVLPLPLREQA